MMSKADIRFSRGSWVGNLYQKFEAVCQEVDDIVSHDHMKILENHVQLVGNNVVKFCSNVKDLIPSSFGAPAKHAEQYVNSVKSNFEVEDGDGECPSAANAKPSPQQMDVNDSSKSWPSCIQVSDDFHFEDNLENPSSRDPSSLLSGLQSGRSDSFFINQDNKSLSKEEKQSSEISDPIFTGSYLLDQNSDSFTEEKQPTCDASELTCQGSSLINEDSDLFTKKEEDSLSDIPELTFPDDDPCERSTSSLFHNQNHRPGDKVSIDSPSAGKQSSGSDLHKIVETVHDTVDEHSSGYDFLCKDETVNDNIHENSPGSEFHLKEEVLCDSIHEFSLGSQVCVKEEMVCDSIHTRSQVSEFQVDEGIVKLISSVTSSHCETAAMRLTSSINSPLLDFSDHRETESKCTEGHTFNDKVVEIGSASTSALASQSSEPYSCIQSPKENIGDMDSSLFPSSSSLEFTEIPIISPSDSEGLTFKHTELGGSCVFVKTDNNHTVSSAVERYWSRKKKIRNPFSSRKKLEKEYKRLPIWYCDIDAEFNEVSGEKLVPSSHNKHPSAQDLQESDWEIL